MKRDFTHEDFEDFLKRSADGLRMKPPDAVWQKLSGELGKRRRRFLLGLSSFLLVASTAGYFIIANVSDNQPPAAEQREAAEAQPSLPATDNAQQQVKPSGSTPAQSVAANKTDAAQATTAVARRGVSANPLRVAYVAGAEASNPAALATNPLSKEAEGNSVENAFTPTIVDSYTEFDKPASGSPRPSRQAASPEQLPLSVESVLNSFRRKARRFETQLYFTPTVSYRKLTENKSYLRAVSPTAVNYPAFSSSVNNNVTHKPDVGFELGFAGKYRLSRHLKLRAGVQFNVNRYDVKAFISQPVNATIALNNGLRIDSLNTSSRYSNVNGYRSDWLQNLSFQVSAPIGAEYVFGGSNNVSFGLAGTVQPTYILGDRAYLITTDYKNYTQVPWLVRRWNVNTAFETFVNIEGERTRWQIGPQVRYQLLSSFISEYPVKENLFDFGLKVGFSLTK